MAPRSPHPAQCLCGTGGCGSCGCEGGARAGATRGSAHPRPSPPPQGDAGVSWQDAVGAAKRRAPHPQSTHREDGVSGESTLSPHCVSHPAEQRRCENPRGRSPATAEEGQPRTTVSAGSSILRASRDWAEAGAWNWVCTATMQPQSPVAGGRSRGDLAGTCQSLSTL